METVDAHIIESRIVACKKCGQKNRLFERDTAGVYRCANPDCRAAIPSPFFRRGWLARVKKIHWVGWAALACASGLLICTFSLQGRLGVMQRRYDAAANEASSGKLLIENLQDAQLKDQEQIKTMTAKVQETENVLAKAEALTTKARLAQDELERKRSAIERELAKVGIPADRAANIMNPSVSTTSSAQTVDDALLRHLPTDNRLATGTVLVDQIRQFSSSAKGTLTLENKMNGDAYVKLVLNGTRVTAFLVRSGDKFTYSTIPDGSLSVLYCTGFGWDAKVRDFARGRHASRCDDLLIYSTKQVRDDEGVTTYWDEKTLTLEIVSTGHTNVSDISLDEFDRY